MLGGGRSPPHRIGRRRPEDRRDGPGGIEAHVEVPLVLEREEPDSARDRMSRERLELGRPVRVDRVVALVVPADPVEQLRPALVLRPRRNELPRTLTHGHRPDRAAVVQD